MKQKVTTKDKHLLVLTTIYHLFSMDDKISSSARINYIVDEKINLTINHTISIQKLKGLIKLIQNSIITDKKRKKTYIDYKDKKNKEIDYYQWLKECTPTVQVFEISKIEIKKKGYVTKPNKNSFNDLIYKIVHDDKLTYTLTDLTFYNTSLFFIREWLNEIMSYIQPKLEIKEINKKDIIYNPMYTVYLNKEQRLTYDEKTIKRINEYFDILWKKTPKNQENVVWVTDMSGLRKYK